ncbi:thioredoxin domain-containing protein [Pedobacter arcticus]|uniref:hypothetical protein n=1 Tax=Pedobacter arcticus TaxID=752140 RepID=UPI0002E4EEB1|nr:hypothetical protein [Pedobacter arcticus]
MRIPTPSDVLIVGVSPVSLGFATLLAKGGLNVLVISELDSKAEDNTQQLQLSLYNEALLKQHGYQLNEETTTQNFIEQSLFLLAHSLCCVVWGTKLISSVKNEHQLEQSGVSQKHQSNFVFNLSDLEINQSNNEANFRNAFVLAWRVIGVQLKNFHPFIMHSFEVEREMIAGFYQDKKEGGILKKWIGKLAPVKPNNLELIGSPVNLHLSQQRVLEAGKLLTDLPFYDEKLKQETSLYKWCNYQYFSLIVIGSVNPHFLFNVAKWVQLNFNIKLFYLPYSEKNECIFETLDISPNEKRTLMIRPDKYISFVNDILETDIIDNYLRNVLLMHANAEKNSSSSSRHADDRQHLTF